jgi:glycerophosphoryl diester phosphodiesterase
MLSRMPLILGHRGVPVIAPENTVAGFRTAIEMGSDGIELDVHLSRDGQIVVIHDERVERTTDGSGLVGEKSFAELRELNAAAKFAGGAEVQQIPTLDQVFDAVGDACRLINIEIKSGVVLYPGIEEKLVELVRRRGAARRVIFSSFNHYSLVELKRLAPEMAIGLLYMGALVEPWHYAARLGAEALHPVHFTVFPEFVAGAHGAGVQVNAWTCDSPADIGRMLASGVDAIITNDVPLAVKMREEESGQP